MLYYASESVNMYRILYRPIGIEIMAVSEIFKCRTTKNLGEPYRGLHDESLRSLT